jgi:hypothetical protein
MENCQYCHKKMSTKYNLIKHQKTAKYCLAIRNKKSTKFKCKYCLKILTQQIDLDRHMNKCEYKMKTIEKENGEQKILLTTKDELISKLENQVNDLQYQLANIAMEAVSCTYEPPVIEIEEDSDESETDYDEPYQLTPLDLGKNYTIQHRDEDGFINVTDLCNSGGKQFNDWKRLQKTTAFIKVLSSSTGIPVDDLIKYNTGSNKERATWVHPQVSINIAQWISPKFDVMVSAWVYEVMMSGKVDISNTKSYRQLQSENKDKQIKIQYLTKKYVKSQPRVQYKEQNVIYILTTKNLKKERRYILGKAINLTNRLSTYNKSDEHEVVFYQECPDEEIMGMVETLVFQKLKEYREQANRERFILPESGNIEIFTDTIKECVKFIK